MASSIHPFASPAEFARAVRRHAGRVLVPTLVIGTLVGVYAFVKPDTWEATQPLAFRNDAAGNIESLGKFKYPEELKTKQETILEIGKSKGVLTRALETVGPPAGYADPAVWPTREDVLDFAREVKLTPPKGVEIGTTEMVYVKVKADSRDRAEQLADAVRDQLQLALQQLRNDRAEHDRRIDQGRGRGRGRPLDGHLPPGRAGKTGRARPVGAAQSARAALGRQRRAAPAGRDRKRAAASAKRERSDRSLLKMLNEAQDDPSKLLATPTRLLESQPALRRLKDGLVDAQLKSADLVGRLADAHPLAKASRASEDEIRRNLHEEIAAPEPASKSICNCRSRTWRP